MMTANNRQIANPASVPRLPRHVRLHFDKLRQAWAVLSPEKVFWPDDTSLAILTKCDGRASISDIAHHLATEFDADPRDIGGDVLSFVQNWSDRMVLRL